MDEPDFSQLRMNDPKAKLDGPKLKFNYQYSEMGGQQMELKLIKTKLKGRVLKLNHPQPDMDFPLLKIKIPFNG